MCVCVCIYITVSVTHLGSVIAHWHCNYFTCLAVINHDQWKLEAPLTGIQIFLKPNKYQKETETNNQWKHMKQILHDHPQKVGDKTSPSQSVKGVFSFLMFLT